MSLANWDGNTAIKRGERLNEKEKAWKDGYFKRLKECGDCSDMTVSGYFLCSDCFDKYTGKFYGEVMHDYVDLEYYQGEFNGGERVLLLLNYYLKGDINEETLVKACELIKKQESLKSDVGSLNLLDEWIENLGLKK